MKRNRLVKSGLVIVLAVAAVGGGAMVFQRQNQPAVQGIATTPGQRNDLRRANLQALKAALVAYQSDHHGAFPVTLPTVQSDICSAISSVCKTAKLVDLNFLPSTGYLNSIPDDPSGHAGHYTTGYAIFREKSGVIHLVAARAEDGADISLSF